MARSKALDKADWQLAPASARVRGWLFGLAFLLPVVLVIVALAATMGGGTSGSLLAGSVALTWLASVGGVGLATGVVWFVLHRALRRHRIELDGANLVVRTTFYTRTIPIADVRVDQARSVVLAERPEYRPTLKTNGFALPGFSSGWFRLRNGERALVATSGGPRAVWLPTTRDHAVLLEPRRPQALLDRLAELAADQARR
ncbi:PH domain-containing protein [Luteimonas pelagia]